MTDNLVEIKRLHDLLANALSYLENLRDEGPDDEGWQSQQLQELENSIRRTLGKPEYKIF